MDERHTPYLLSLKPPKVDIAEVNNQTRLSVIRLTQEYFVPETKTKLHYTKRYLETCRLYTKHGENHKNPNTYHHESFSGMSLSL